MKTRASLMAVLLLACTGCAAEAHLALMKALLREMADRRQLEADLLAREVGPNDPSVEKKRRLADELRAAAVEADKKAQARSAQVPHNMVQ